MASSNNGHKPVRCVLVGYGRMGQMLAEACRALSSDDLAVIAMADDRPEARSAAEADFAGSLTTFSSATEAYEAENPDACIIATPTPTHAPLVREAIDSGLHVFCEKPLSWTPELDIELAELADKNSRILQLGFFRRFSTPWRKARELVRSGRLGGVRYIRCTSWDGVIPPLSFCDPKVSGGLIMDNGVHEFDAIEWITGQRIVRVTGLHGRDAGLGLHDVDDVDFAAILVKLKNGAVATIDLARNARYSDDMRTEILCDHGGVFVEYFPTSYARVGDDDGMTELPGSRVNDGFFDGVTLELSAFADLCRGKAIEYAGARASARAICVAKAANVAAETGCWTEVSDIGWDS